MREAQRVKEIGHVSEVSEETGDWTCEVEEFWDDLTGKALDSDGVKKARAEEIA